MGVVAKMADVLRQRRELVWASGRAVSARLLEEYRQTYRVERTPPPALIVGELLTDFLDVELIYGPLNLDTYARVRWEGKIPQVTVNVRIPEMPGVKDPEGVGNVAKCHELIHVVDHAPEADLRDQYVFEGFDVSRSISCYRRMQPTRDQESRLREIWAEEAGRAFAVSWPHLKKSAAFQELLGFAGRREGREAWRLLYLAARDIGVNSTALVKQLTLEGVITVAQENGRRLLRVSSTFEEGMRLA